MIGSWRRYRRFLKNGPRKAADPDEFAERTSADGSEYYYYQPIRATGTQCFTACHQPMSNVTGGVSTGGPVMGNSVAEAEGDLMAVAQLTFSTQADRKTASPGTAPS